MAAVSFESEEQLHRIVAPHPEAFCANWNRTLPALHTFTASYSARRTHIRAAALVRPELGADRAACAGTTSAASGTAPSPTCCCEFPVLSWRPPFGACSAALRRAACHKSSVSFRFRRRDCCPTPGSPPEKQFIELWLNSRFRGRTMRHFSQRFKALTSDFWVIRR